MKTDMNDILNPPAEPQEAAAEPEQQPGETNNQAGTAEQTDQQVAASETGGAETPSPGEKDDAVKAELAALAKERERIRRREAAVDEREARLNEKQQASSQQSVNQEQQAASTAEQDGDARAELKTLRKQYRDALIIGDEEEAERLEDLIDEKQAELSLSALEQKSARQREQQAADREKADFQTAYDQIHDTYPFLKPDHPQASAELNNKINTWMSGLLAQGKSRTEALTEAVEMFVPKSAEQQGQGSESVREDSGAADSGLQEKLKRQGFSEVRSASTRQATTFSGPTPMSAILGGKA